MKTKEQIIERLNRQTSEQLLNSPYARHTAMELSTIEQLKEISADPNVDLAQIRPLLLADVSLEIESLIVNSLNEASDQDISDRAEKTVAAMFIK